MHLFLAMEAATKQRTVARIKVTRQGNKLLQICDGNPVTKAEYFVELEDFHEKVIALKKAQSEVESYLTPEQFEEDIEAADKYEAEHVKNVLVATRQTALADGDEDPEQDKFGSCNSHTSNVAEAKLPKLSLPKFSGEVQDWLPFWEQFEAIIDNREDLPVVTKFSYLRETLVGDAKRAIAGLSLTGVNYKTACDILKERFGRTNKIIFAHVQALLGVAVPDRPSVEALWILYSDLQSHIRSLDSLGITGQQYGVILTPLILSRLPAPLRLEWAREGERAETARQAKVKTEWSDDVQLISWEADLDFLMTFLKREIQRRETSQTYNADGQLDATTPPPPPPSATALHNATGRASQSTTATQACALCPRPRFRHSTAKCPSLKALSFKDKKDRLFAASVCIKCLQKSTPAQPHAFKRCQGKCALCNGPHHKILCSQNNKPSTATPNLSTNSAPNSSPTTSPTMTASSVSQSKHEVLLQTLRVSVGGRGGKRKVLVLFDTGADRSYVTQNLVDKIKPEFVDTTLLSCASFGSVKPQSAERREIFNLTLEAEGKGVAINATCVPTICAPLCQPSVPSEILNQIPCADFVSIPAGEELKVDVLVGMDSYWNFFTADVHRLSDELVAHLTHFGWVLSGRLPATGLLQCKAGEVSHQLLCQSVEPVESLWSLEAIGIADYQSTDDHVWSDFESEIKKVDGRYAVGLPWKDGMAERLRPN